MPGDNSEPALVAEVDANRDHLLGSLNSPVVLVEYGDFECPHCRRARHTVNQLRKELGQNLCFVFRHFPLSQIHPHAEGAAEAAEAAAAQGRFWEMHEALFDHQDDLEDQSLSEYAARIGIDVKRFAMDLEEGKFTPRVREDFMSGVRSGVNGTPTFFINGRRHDGPPDAASMLQAITSSVPAAGEHRHSRTHKVSSGTSK